MKYKLPIILSAIVLMAFATVVFANTVSLFRTQSATATSTVVYQSVGAATTTLAFDLAGGTNTVADSAALKVQFTASTTASVPRIDIEYADATVGFNCVTTPLACDWYQNNLIATSTGVINNVQSPTYITWQFASTTIGGSLNTTQTVNKIFSIPTPTRYVRAVMSVTGANGAWWVEWVAKKQSQ